MYDWKAYTHTCTHIFMNSPDTVFHAFCPLILQQAHQHSRIPDSDSSERLSNLPKVTQLINDGSESGFSDTMLFMLCFGATTG